MLDLFDSISKTFSHPQQAHAALVHTPIALAMLGLIPLLLLVLTRGRLARWRWTCVFVYALAAATAMAAANAGENASSENSTMAPMSDAADVVFTRHEEMGELVFWFLAATALAAALSSIPKKWFRVVTLLVAVGLGVFSAGWVMATAHLGGRLVYEFGVGVPLPVVEEEAGGVEDPETPVPAVVESEHVGTTQPATQATPADAATTLPDVESPVTQPAE
jgi:uncharacterized membrane protein